MKITKVGFTRKFNLGGYESLDVSAEAELNEKDNALEVWTILKDNAEMWFIDLQRAKTKPQQTEPEMPKGGVIIDLETLVWQDMPATEKGVWQKSETKNASYYAIKKAIEEKDGKPTFMGHHIVWLNSDGTLGRRKK